jgi:two-component system cell cycle response regulator
MARILVVDDNRSNLDLMTFLLTAFGHEVVGFEEPQLALGSALSARYDLILADIRMPQMDGFEFLRRFRSRTTEHVPVIAVTAHAMVGDKERMLEAGFDGYISKPIDPEVLKLQIEELLALKRDTRPVILAVDDIAANLDVLEGTLAPFGFRVVRAESVKEAKAQLNDVTPSLILCDIHMPGEDGFNLIAHVKGDPNLKEIPLFVMSSTMWRTSEKQRALELGAEKLIMRPIEPQALVNEVRAAIAR